MTTYRDESGPGDTTAWTYDPATGLLVQKLYDDGKGPSYTYTPDGKLASRTWARGVVTEYGYDALGSLLSVNYSDATPDVTYTYDRIGRQLSAIAAGVSTNLFTYSTNTLELIAEVQNGVVINRSRDAFGRASGIALESDYDVSYSYDTYGRFAAVTHAQSTNNFVYSYLPGSSLVSGMTASSGHAWTRAYEPHRNLITSVTNSFNGNLISAFDYVNDSIGRRTARLDSQPAGVAITNAFGYNMRSEVTSALMSTNTYGYVFDPIGNRIVSTNNADVTSYAANELNQYTAISNAVVALPTHDDDGNMTATGDGWHYVWNGENRLVLASNENALVTYAYDHQGRMVWKVVSRRGAEAQSWEAEKSMAYLWDDFNIIAETVVADSATNATYNIWGLDLSGTLQGAGGVGGLLAVVKDSATYIPAWDANGNIMEYVAEDGSIAAHREYDPFGGTIVYTSQSAITNPQSAMSFTHWFSTKPWCAVTGLSEYQYRKFSPTMGRWMNRDPIEEAGGANLYVNCYNSTIRYIDPFGDSVYDLPVKKFYDVPVDPMKCRVIRAIISGGAAIDHVNRKLWNAWLDGTGDPGVSFDDFDTDGLRNEIGESLDRIAENSGSGYGYFLPCNSEGTAAHGSFSFQSLSSHRMISSWTYTLRYLVIARKTCRKERPCCEISITLMARHSASDTTDFNNGINPDTNAPWSFDGGGFRITDRLVNACNKRYNWGAKDFQIAANEVIEKKLPPIPCD